jgi:Ser/Thr protein kinase RdoA (MazF antagonist)
MIFPVIHSTLDPVALTREVESRYPLNGPVRCQLISRANNDFYEVSADGKRYALRVSKADFRSRDDYAFEASYVRHLYNKGCKVPAPVPAKDGRLFFEVEAPEGTRAISLMHWLDGAAFTKSLTAADASEMGGALAYLHEAGLDFEPDTARTINTSDILDERMPALLAMLESDPDHRDFYVYAAKKVQGALRGLNPDTVRCGPVHGDYQFANVLKTQEGSISILDFDTCGIGYCAEDLFTFIWRSDMEIQDEQINEAFLSGYESVRPLKPVEKALYPTFRVARDLVMSSSFAILINRVGPVPGFDGDFGPFTNLTRQHLVDAGLD